MRGFFHPTKGYQPSRRVAIVGARVASGPDRHGARVKPRYPKPVTIHRGELIQKANHYRPHQGTRECARRRRQMEKANG